jgi:hypothetical protein
MFHDDEPPVCDRGYFHHLVDGGVTVDELVDDALFFDDAPFFAREGAPAER